MIWQRLDTRSPLNFIETDAVRALKKSHKRRGKAAEERPITFSRVAAHEQPASEQSAAAVKFLSPNCFNVLCIPQTS
jgi:hypothetical protein